MLGLGVGFIKLLLLHEYPAQGYAGNASLPKRSRVES